MGEAPPDLEPAETPREHDGRSNTSRTEAFSDGVLAIAITLLVLDLHSTVPPGQTLVRVLLEQWPGYLAYLTSFLAIGIVWLNHHAYFERLREIDRTLQWANLGLLLFVSVLPFPTAILASNLAGGGADARVAAAVYGLSGLLMTAPWVLLWRHLAREPDLFRKPYDAAFARKEASRAWVGIVAYGVCGLIGLLVPYLAAFLYLAIALFYALTSRGWDSVPGVRRATSSNRGRGAE